MSKRFVVNHKQKSYLIFFHFRQFHFILFLSLFDQLFFFIKKERMENENEQVDGIPKAKKSKTS